jgi:cytidylate kinase
MARSTERIVDEQIRRWRLEREQRGPHTALVDQAPHVVTLSAPLGTQGNDVAREVGRNLNLPVYDREIVKHIAESNHLQLETVKTLDEQIQSRFDDYLTALLRERNFDANDYVHALARTVTALWHHGPCILVGRGSHLILPRSSILAIRLIAPQPYRLHVLLQRNDINEAEALRRLNRADGEREAFARRYFGTSLQDPLHFDLLLNTAHLPPHRAATIIVRAYFARFGSPRRDAERSAA